MEPTRLGSAAENAGTAGQCRQPIPDVQCQRLAIVGQPMTEPGNLLQQPLNREVVGLVGGAGALLQQALGGIQDDSLVGCLFGRNVQQP